MILELDDDAFADSQISSKLTLCEEIERTFNFYLPARSEGARIDIYAGWYGMTAFLLLSRGRINIDKIRSFDVDPAATRVANRLNRHFMITTPIFQAFTYDVNKLKPEQEEVDIVVNTAVEHMTSDEWFINIPSGTWVALQGTNLHHPNEDVPNPIKSMEQFLAKYPLRSNERLHYNTHGLEDSPDTTEIHFSYPNTNGPDMKFTRFQIVGIKR